MIFLGADIGTTRIKAVAYREDDARTVATAARPTPVAASADGDVHDPEALLAGVTAVLAEVVAQLPAPAEVAAVSVVGLGEEVVLVDGAGTPLAPAPAWYDSPGRHLAAQSPHPANSTFSVFVLRWFAQERADVARTTARFTDPPSFVASQLAGLGADLVMDHSHASRTGFFDAGDRTFTPAELAWAGGWERATPRLVGCGEVIGRLDPGRAARLGLGSEVAVVSGAHDHLAAAFASGVRRPGDAMLSAGTSEAALVLCAGLPADPGPGVDVGAFLDGTTGYVHRNVRGGQLFGRWRALLHLGGEPADAWFEPPAWPPPGAPLPLCRIDADAGTVGFDRLTFDVDPAVVMRTLGEGLALTSRATFARLEVAAGRPAERITVGGAAGAVPAWARLRAAVLGRPLEVVRTPEPTALGAAVLAQRALRGHADIPVETVTVEPPRDPAARDYYARLIDAHARTAT